MPMTRTGFYHAPVSSILAQGRTRVVGRSVCLLAWYEIEWGYLADGAVVMRRLCTNGAPAPRGMRVTDRIALSLGLIIVACVAADLVLNDARALMFLLVKFTDMIEWLAFWR